jgi:topoisomerase IA-like protein
MAKVHHTGAQRQASKHNTLGETMINKPHSVALRLTPEEYTALVHVQLRDGDKTLAITLRKVVEPLLAEGAKSLEAIRKKAEAKAKRDAKKAAANVVL